MQLQQSSSFIQYTVQQCRPDSLYFGLYLTMLIFLSTIITNLARPWVPRVFQLSHHSDIEDLSFSQVVSTCTGFTDQVLVCRKRKPRWFFIFKTHVKWSPWLCLAWGVANTHRHKRSSFQLRGCMIFPLWTACVNFELALLAGCAPKQMDKWWELMVKKRGAVIV